MGRQPGATNRPRLRKNQGVHRAPTQCAASGGIGVVSRELTSGVCDSINACRRVMKQGPAFGGGIPLSNPLESIPNRDIGIRRFIDREVAFEHAAMSAEFLYAKVEKSPHRTRHLG